MSVARGSDSPLRFDAVALAKDDDLRLPTSGVHLLDELGVAEAIWDLEVRGLPAVVTMDAHGESLHAERTGA